MILAEKIVIALLEGDDEDIKGILGHDYLEPLAPPTKEGDVYRHDRWMDVTIGDIHFCVSYLTPVAIYSPDLHVIRTERDWSTSTVRHIKKWLDKIGFDASERWPEIQRRFPKTMSQAELIKLFREESAKVNWNKRQVRSFDAVPYNKIQTGLRSGSKDQVQIYPDSPPPRDY